MSTLLRGIRVIELAGLAPVPHCGLMLADFGADVTIIERPEGEMVEQRLSRGKKTVRMDLKSKEGVEKLRELCRTSDVLLDPYRPGILEKMGLDPVKLLEENAGLVVCRLTGFGQIGELSQEAGHDINYVAITGLLPTLAGHKKSNMWPPANLLADFAGGGLTAAFGIVTALLGRTTNGGKGSIIDCSMVEGLSYLGSFVSQYHDMSHLWTDPYAAFSGDCPIYRNYETKDGKYMSVGALEPKFNAKLFELLQYEKDMSDMYKDPVGMVKDLEGIFKTKTRDEWTKIFQGQDACVTPVLDMKEAAEFPHNSQRGSFIKEGEKWIPRPAPKIYTKEEFAALKKSKL